MVAQARTLDRRIGNKFYLLVKRPGRKPKHTPHTLWQQATDYFDATDKKRLPKEIVLRSKGGWVKHIVYKRVPFTLAGLRLHLGISKATWHNYRNNAEYRDTCLMIEQIVYVHQFEGAAVGIFNPKIIWRRLCEQKHF